MFVMKIHDFKKGESGVDLSWGKTGALKSQSLSLTPISCVCVLL